MIVFIDDVYNGHKEGVRYGDEWDATTMTREDAIFSFFFFLI
jgi:hypothetical protein